MPVVRTEFTSRFGIEAPYVPAGLAATAGLLSVSSAVLHRRSLLFPAAVSAGSALVYVHTTLRGKHLVWRRAFDDLALHGDERLLDVGCGRGAVLLTAAQRLPSGRAVGIDLWRSSDQSGNDPARAMANAHALGVADRVELHTGDMTSLPFPDGSFDVVASALAVHNVPTSAGRRQAVCEMARVLKSGGRLALVDIKHTADYARAIAGTMINIRQRKLGVNYWYGGPWMSATAITATRR